MNPQFKQGYKEVPKYSSRYTKLVELYPCRLMFNSPFGNGPYKPDRTRRAPLKIAISGFGRIGRCTLRVLLERPKPGLEVAAINSPGNPRMLAHLLKYDSTYGVLPFDVDWEPDAISVQGVRYQCLSEQDPSKLDWNALDVDVVLDCSGKATEREKAQAHISSGAQRVIISAPSEEADVTLIPGCNMDDYNPEDHRIISMGSCTTNCLATTLKVLNDSFSVQNAFATTVHSYTNDQRLLDGTHEDLRRARAAGQSLIPTKTGASSTIDRLFPELKGKVVCNAIRAPTSSVSLLNIVASTRKPATSKEVNRAYRDASHGPLRGILELSEEPLVSIDYKKNTHSSIIDSLSTSTSGGLIRVLAWYDNEWAYAVRLVESALHIGGSELRPLPRVLNFSKKSN